MPIRVSPTEARPTHHIALQDRSGRTVGLVLCDEKGQPIRSKDGLFTKIPVDTTAQKQTSGSSSYNDYEYPYSPIVQDDTSGGRGNLDFERDTTKYFDSFRARSGRPNRVYAGPLETYATGVRTAEQYMPGSVSWHKLTGTQRYLYRRFTASATFDIRLAWLLLRRKSTPSNLTIQLRSDSAGSVGNLLASATIAYTDTADTLMEWMVPNLTYSVASGTAYWLVVYASDTDNETAHWMIGMKNSTGSTYYSASYSASPSAYTKDLYMRLTDANTNKTCIPYQYKEQQYFVISPETGSPKLYIAGDRGTADSNAGQLSKLIDATKTWTTNEFAGAVVKIIDGTGSTESTQYRTIVSNTATQLTVSPEWTITHDTTTEYVIYGAKLTEITGHGLTAPVTDVLVTTQGIILFAQGDSVNIRRMKEETSAGAWTRTYADDGTNKATYLDYKPQANKIVKANQRDGSGNTSIAIADPVAWATASHTFAAAQNVDSKYIRITGTAVYPDESGEEAVWVFKEDLPYIVPGTGNPYPLNLEEMKTVRSERNGRNPLLHNVYLYFTLGYGLERYYSGQVDDVGPNQGEGLPKGRRGPISYMVGYPGKFFIATDAGTAGYGSVLESGGWHERYRAPKGQRITAMAFQVVPGDVPDRLWIWQGNDLLYLPYPSDTVNELEDSNYLYAPEFAVTLARMHAGLFDVMKIVRRIKLQTDNLETNEVTGEPVCWFELDYRLNEESDWQTADDIFSTSPTQEIDFVNMLGLAGKRLQFRVRGYTTDNTKTPVLLAIIINAVIRTDVKYMYGPFDFRCMDMEPTLDGGQDELRHAREKAKIIEDWADSSSDSMLKIEALSELLHGKVVYMNTPQFRQIAYGDDESNPYKRSVYICRVSFQEA